MTITTTLTCEQAIFTSTRTPTGEGYRIIAAGKGLRPDEKQVIIRNSPSHDSLCPLSEEMSKVCDWKEPRAFALYPLPGGRLCAAYSCNAGAEHTGRGGQRVYTFNLVFPTEQFAHCAFNPFHILRAMVTAGLTTPQLNPPPMLPEIQLEVGLDWAARQIGPWRTIVPSVTRRYSLQGLLGDRALLFNLCADWFDAAEALLLGLPGPLRSKLSFCAGLKYSAGRTHRLYLLHDATPATKNRTAGQKISYVEPDSVRELLARGGAWIDFVERMWERGDLSALARRTSRAFADVSLDARERMAKWYNTLDGVANLETPKILAMVGESLVPIRDEVERAIVDELHAAAQRILCDRFQTKAWSETAIFWPTIVHLWRRGEVGCKFALPLLESALRSAMRDDPVAAAKAALLIARDVPEHAKQESHTALLDGFWKQLVAWAEHASQVALQPLRPLLTEWRSVRRNCPMVTRLLGHYSSPSQPAMVSGQR